MPVGLVDLCEGSGGGAESLLSHDGPLRRTRTAPTQAVGRRPGSLPRPQLAHACGITLARASCTTLPGATAKLHMRRRSSASSSDSRLGKKGRTAELALVLLLGVDRVVAWETAWAGPLALESRASGTR
jgi:hypothetical protein